MKHTLVNHLMWRKKWKMRVKCDERASRLELTAISYFLRERERGNVHSHTQNEKKKKKKKKVKYSWRRTRKCGFGLSFHFISFSLPSFWIRRSSHANRTRRPKTTSFLSLLLYFAFEIIFPFSRDFVGVKTNSIGRRHVTPGWTNLSLLRGEDWKETWLNSFRADKS